jgi:PPM family protein phosphatase
VQQSAAVVNPPRFRFRFAARTDEGRVRTSNEDAFDTRPEEGFVIVADGMGGHNAGEVASRIAVDTALQHLLEQVDGKAHLEHCLDKARQALDRANRAIVQAVHQSPALRGMGTTLVLGMFRQGVLGFAWIGDSRLYRLRNRQLMQLTTDHTLVQELVSQNLFATVEAAVAAGVRENVLVRALGTEYSQADLGSVDLAPGDIFLFCSDGLNHMVDTVAIEQALIAPDISLDAKADRLVQLACDAGGRDNITVALVEVAAAGV